MAYPNKKFKTLGQGLRKNSTDAERKLWLALKNKQILEYKFTKQYSVNNFILNFYRPQI